MGRRLFDILASAIGLLLLAIPLAVVMLLVWRQDRHSPLYVADRGGVGGKPFRMIKIRSMVAHADKTGVESTSADDDRITPLGHFIRRWKIDELSQLWNVLKGDMSLVGPRPNTMSEIGTYADWERPLLSVRPGITDFSSIVFSDEGEILKFSPTPDADYTRQIRPWKGQLGLIYVHNASLLLNVCLILLTICAIFNKPAALRGVLSLLRSHGASEKLIELSQRKFPLSRYSPGVST